MEEKYTTIHTVAGARRTTQPGSGGAPRDHSTMHVIKRGRHVQIYLSKTIVDMMKARGQTNARLAWQYDEAGNVARIGLKQPTEDDTGYKIYTDRVGQRPHYCAITTDVGLAINTAGTKTPVRVEETVEEGDFYLVVPPTIVFQGALQPATPSLQ